jgi:hypothetical protein
MTAAYIAEALKARRSGSGWMARCPAHHDCSPSLSVRELHGKILIHCFAGCSQDDVIAALRDLGLWPERPRRNWTRDERRDYARRRAHAERRAEEALFWRAAMVRRLERAKTAAYMAYLRNPDPPLEQAWADAAQQLFIHTSLCGATLIEKVDEAIRLDPVHAHRLIVSQHRNETEARQCTAIVVAMLTLTVGGAR